MSNLVDAHAPAAFGLLRRRLADVFSLVAVLPATRGLLGHARREHAQRVRHEIVRDAARVDETLGGQAAGQRDRHDRAPSSAQRAGLLGDELGQAVAHRAVRAGERLELLGLLGARHLEIDAQEQPRIGLRVGRALRDGVDAALRIEREQLAGIFEPAREDLVAQREEQVSFVVNEAYTAPLV